MRTRLYRWVSDTRDDSNELQDPPSPVEPLHFRIPIFIHALFTLPRAYLRQCAHFSIVVCWAQRMMVVGYNGILSQDDG